MVGARQSLPSNAERIDWLCAATSPCELIDGCLAGHGFSTPGGACGCSASAGRRIGRTHRMCALMRERGSAAAYGMPRLAGGGSISSFSGEFSLLWLLPAAAAATAAAAAAIPPTLASCTLSCTYPPLSWSLRVGGALAWTLDGAGRSRRTGPTDSACSTANSNGNHNSNMHVCSLCCSSCWSQPFDNGNHPSRPRGALQVCKPKSPYIGLPLAIGMNSDA